jgi:hypothetical protein
VKLSDLTPQDAENKGGGLLPPGAYVVAVTDAEETTSSNGNPMLVVHLEVLVGEYRGRGLRDWVVFTPNTKWKVAQLLVGLGLPIPEGEFELKPEDLIARKCGISVKEEVWNEKVQTRVDSYSPLDEGVEVPDPAPKVDIPF